MVVGLAAAHLGLDLVLPESAHAIPAGIPVALLIVPVSYAALHYGLSGSISTSLWATLLWLPDLLLPNDAGHVGNDVIELTVVVAAAAFIGRHIESEWAARSQVEQAEREHRDAEVRVRRYAGLLLSAQEEERRRLAQELHDDPIQVLVYLARQLEALESSPEVTPKVAKSLMRARRQARDTLGHLQSVVQGLRPPAIERLGLVASLRGYLAEVADTAPNREFRVTGTERRMPAGIELGLFRIAQEAVNNVIRHASAHRLGVTIEFQSDHVALQVDDDGAGFDLDALQMQPEAARVGIEGMRERAELLGGRVHISSSSGSGTTLRTTIPLPG